MTLYRVTESVENGGVVYKVWSRPSKGSYVWVCFGDEYKSEKEALKRVEELKEPVKKIEYKVLYEDKE